MTQTKAHRSFYCRCIGFFSKDNTILPYMPVLLILIIGMGALHISVKLTEDHQRLQQYYDAMSAYSHVMDADGEGAQSWKIYELNASIRWREKNMYWAVIFISLTAYLLLIMNGNKFRRLSALNREKLENLKLLEDRLAAIEASAEGIGIVDHNDNLIYMNSAMSELHGIAPHQRQEYIGIGWLNLYSDRGREEFSTYVMPLFEKQGAWRGKTKILRKDGVKIHVELSMTRLKGGGFIGTVRDITAQEKADSEKREIENQLAQAQKMEAVGQLAGGIAHDFNNILAAMNGYAEFLSEDLEDGGKGHSYAMKILAAGRQARELVDRILTFSRRNDNNSEIFNLNDPIAESLSMLEATLPKNITIKTNLDMKDAFVYGNGSQISQMIMNLCVNASDAMEGQNGSLSISLHNVDEGAILPDLPRDDQLSGNKNMALIRIEDGMQAGQTLLYLGALSRDQRYMRLCVQDTGCGMSRVIMAHIFEPFFTTKDVHKGTGLGLATVHGVVIGHQGAMVIDSRVREGTRFEIFLPMSDVDEVEQGKHEPLSADDAGEIQGAQILLVEDQPEVRDMSVTMLQRMGYDVECAENGLVALDILRENPGVFDLVIADQNMPKMTGLNLVNQAHMDFENLPFILLSGYSQEKLQSLMIDHPAIKAVLRKPVAQQELQKHIVQALMENNKKAVS